MKDFFIYQLEVAFCLAVFYVFYRLFLRKDSNFHAKRIFIVAIGIVAFIVPALNIHYSVSGSESPIPIGYFTMITEQAVVFQQAPVASNEINPWLILFLIWGIGFAVMILRLLISLFHVSKILKQAVPASDNNKFRITYQGVQSFSFFKTIVLNNQHFQSELMKYILAHERVHSNQYHSADVLFIELLKSVQWFNPFAWLIAGEALKNLEYLADRDVVASLKNPKEYQLALVQLTHRSTSRLLRTEFSKSNLKNRISMMNRPNNQKVNAGKFLFLIPIIGVLFMSFSLNIENLDLRKEISEMLPVLDVIESKIKEPINQLSVKKQPLNSTENNAHFDKTDAVDTTVKVFTLEDEHSPSASVDDESIHSGLNPPEEAIRLVQNGPKLFSGVQRGENVKIRLETPGSFRIQNHQDSLRIIKGRVITEDGKVFPGANIVVKGSNIGTVSDIDGRFALEVSPDHHQLIIYFIGMNKNVIDIQNANEFVIIMVPTSDNKEVKFNGENGNSIVIQSKFNNQKNQPLFIVDGTEFPTGILKSIDPKDIASIDILKDSAAIKKYGEKGKYGVVIIKTKK